MWSGVVANWEEGIDEIGTRRLKSSALDVLCKMEITLRMLH